LAWEAGKLGSKRRVFLYDKADLPVSQSEVVPVPGHRVDAEVVSMRPVSDVRRALKGLQHPVATFRHCRFHGALSILLTRAEELPLGLFESANQSSYRLDLNHYKCDVIL